MENIIYGADSIQVLEGLEAVRKRPGMYIGSTSLRGLNHLIYEILDNSVDEYLAGYCDKIWITLEKDGSCTVKDNGRGIPVGMHEKGISAERLVLTTLHAGGKFNNDVYKTSGGLHGVGSSVVNALSKKLKIRVCQNGNIYYDEYEKGKPVIELKDGLLPVEGKTTETGTEINFLPDSDIFESIVFQETWLKNRLHETAYLNPNLIIYYKDLRKGKNEEIVFSEPDGLKAYIKDLVKDKETVCEPIYFKGENEGTQVECCFVYVNEFEENLHSFCNNIFTQEGGSHVTGFKNRYAGLINSYARDLNILKEKDSNFTGADTRNGMIAVLSVKCMDPLFEGQTKTKLASANVMKHVAKITGDELTKYFDRHLTTLNHIIDCALRSAKIRKSEEKTKQAALTKTGFSFEGNGKLRNCISKNPEECEIFIVEGDSAGGSASSGRDRQTQAILAIRGKILNVEKASIDKVLSNAEIKSMINAFGCGFSEGYGNDFDINKLKYNKIILMTDADVDGSHIDTLLLTFLYRFMPELIHSGHVYLAQPPLYKAESKSGTIYIQTDNELKQYIKKHREGSYKLQRYKGYEKVWPLSTFRFVKRVECLLIKFS